MNILLRHRKAITILLGVLCVTPLLFTLVEMWDSSGVELATMRQNFQVIERYLEKGWYLPYWAYVYLNKVYVLTGVPYKFFLNILTVASVLGFAREIYLFARNRLGLESEYAYVACWSAIAFPVWHVLIPSAVFVYILCMWLFMLGVRYWYGNRIVVSLLFFLFAAQLFSNFSLAIGFIALDYCLSVNRHNWQRKTVFGMGLSLAVLLAYVLLTSAINVHGQQGDYNTITVDNLLKYTPELVVYCLAVAAAGYGLSFKIADSGERQRFIRTVLGLGFLLFFAIFPYNAIGRPMRYFAFGSFTARHAMLSAVPLTLLLGVLVRYVALNFREKIAVSLAVFILLAQVVILHQGYSHKAAALVFKDMLTDAFRATDPPLSGYVAIQPVGYAPPRHVNCSAVNVCLARAYGKTAWLANGYWRRHRSLEPKWMKDLYGTGMGRPLCVDVTGEAYTKYTFSLTDFHQEGRFWYWYYYLAHEYSSFRPELKKVMELKRWDM